MTNKIENEALDYIKKIDEFGGAVAAIEQGFIQREIQESAYAYQKSVESNERIVVGVNKFKVENEKLPELLKVKPEVETQQKAHIEKLRQQRDNAKVQSSLQQLKETAETDTNLMPAIIEAVSTYATLGEICDVLRQVFGEYRPSVIF